MASVTYHVPCLTTLAAARAAAGGIADARAHPLVVRALQDLHRGRVSRVVSDRSVMATMVGSVGLPNPIMTASGTSGHGVELGDYGDLSAARRRRGEVRLDPPLGRQSGAPGARGRVRHVEQRRVCRAPAWRPGWPTISPRWLQSGARVVVSIWGQSVDDYARRGSNAGPGGRRERARPSWPSR